MDKKFCSFLSCPASVVGTYGGKWFCWLHKPIPKGGYDPERKPVDPSRKQTRTKPDNSKF